MSRSIILDCDPGHDDAIAMVLAASDVSDLNVEAITTVAGNVAVEKTTQNALKICDVIGLQDVPVAKGAEGPLIRSLEIAEEIHGETGLDGPEFSRSPKKQVVDQHGVDLIIEKIMNSQDAITIVPTGPLTNIALAMIKEPKINSKIKEIVLMGGGTFGNWTPVAEFNIFADVEAAKVVFDSEVPISMFGLDVTHQAIATSKIIKQLFNIDNSVAHFVVELLTFFAQSYEESFEFSGPPIHDACTVAYLINPSIFKLRPAHVDIETKGEFTYGTTVIDSWNHSKENSNVQVAHQLDSEKFWELITKALESYN